VFDGQAGLHQNRFRDYDPAVGGYPQSDPIGLAGGSRSTYAYGNGNSLSRTDPTGQSAVAIPVGVVVAVGVAACYIVPNCWQGLEDAANALLNPPLSDPMFSKALPPGYWPGDKGAEEWGRRHGIGADAGRRRFHKAKQGCPGSKPTDVFGVNPDTGAVVDPEGEVIDNLGEVNAK